jgi:3-oxoacyl-[acyl-carrier protein] reductase
MKLSSLKNKIVLITGGTRGIGWATARKFAELGATVLIAGFSDRDKLDARVLELTNTYGVKAAGYLFDISDQAGVQQCFQDIFKCFKRLDVLVNNAGILDDRLLGMIQPQDVSKTLEVNVSGTIYCLQAAARLMGRKPAGGSIINLSSIIGRCGNEGQVVYAASKAAVIGITRSAAKELAEKNIRVNAVAPGFIETDMIKNIPEEIYNQRMQSIKMKRIGKPADVANAILFLASDEAGYITGQTLGVDGGMLI